MRCKTELSDLPGYYIPAHWEASGPPRSPNPAPLPGFTDSPMDEGLSVDPSRYISPVCTGLYRALLASVPVHRTSFPAPSHIGLGPTRHRGRNIAAPRPWPPSRPNASKFLYVGANLDLGQYQHPTVPLARPTGYATCDVGAWGVF